MSEAAPHDTLVGPSGAQQALDQQRLSEAMGVHTRLLKGPLCIEESRAYWSRIHAVGEHRANAALAFEESWFGAKSMAWVKVLLTNMRARFDAYPQALFVLAGWRTMPPDVRRLICHWHLQLSDPLYRAFTGDFLVRRRDRLHAEVDRHAVVRWIEEWGPSRWTPATRQQFGSRLLSCAQAAGLVKGNRDPRALSYPKVSDDALSYLLGLLRSLQFAGTMFENPYLASVGLEGALLADRLRMLDIVDYQRAGDLHNFDWRFDGLVDWAQHTVIGGEG